MELVVGCHNKSEVASAQALIGEFSFLQITPIISNRAYEWLVMFNKSHGLLIPDALIAATAFVHQMQLMTDNLKHFLILPDIMVERPY